MTPKSKLDIHLDRMRDEFKYSVYYCPICKFRGFGGPVFIHELETKHKMIKEIPNERTKTS